MFGGRREFFRARTGSWNYNLNDENSDEDYKVFVFPTFEDLYNGEKFSESYIGKEIDLNVHDIRKLPMLFWKSNLAFLELLYSDKIVRTMETKDFNIMTHPQAEQVIDRSGELMHELFLMRDKLVTMNLPHLFGACIGTHNQKMKLIHKGTESTQILVDTYGYDCKQALHAMRMLDFLTRFAHNDFGGFKEALYYPNSDSNRDFLLSLKHGEISEEEFLRDADNYLKIAEEDLKEKYCSQPVDEKTNEKLIHIVKEIVKINII